MVTAAATVIDPDVTPAAIPIHLDPKLARRRRDATSRYKLLTDQQQGTFIVGEMPNGLRRARLLTRYRQVRHEIEARKSEAPVSFEYDDVVADVNHDAARIEDVHWIERPVHLRFTIWTPVAWMVAHGRAVYLRHHVGRTRTYHDGLEDRYLLECHPPYSDLLWFGEGLARGGFIRTGRSIDGPGSSTRRRDPSAPTWGDIHFAGLLMPCAGLSNWIAFRYPEAILIEPETLYRGVLYGSAYSVLGLTSGARFYELVACHGRIAH